MEGVIGRVLRRRAFAYFSVLEVAATSVDGERLAAPRTVCAILKAEGAKWADGAGVEAEAVSEDVFAFVKGSVRLGDVVHLSGVFDEAGIGSALDTPCEQPGQGITGEDGDGGRLSGLLGGRPSHTHSTPSSGTPKLPHFRVSAVALLEKWDASAHGDMYYTKGAPLAESQPQMACHSLPQLIVQCHSSFVARVVAYIHATDAYAAVLAQPSSTHLSKSSERLVLLHLGASSAGREERVAGVQEALEADANLVGVVKRVYRFDGDCAGCFARISEVVSWLPPHLAALHAPPGNPTRVRLQSFDSVLGRSFLASWAAAHSRAPADQGRVGGEVAEECGEADGLRSQGAQGLGAGLMVLDPKGYEMVLSLVFAAGCIYASLLPRGQVYVYMYTYTCIHMYTCVAAAARSGIRIHARTGCFRLLCMLMYVCMYALLYVCMYALLHVCAPPAGVSWTRPRQARPNVLLCVCVYTYTYMYVYMDID